MLLPAVQKVREAAARAKCANNLKQIALALHSLHDAEGQFPYGGVTNGPCCGTLSGPTWTIFILPYVEQGPLFNQYNMALPNEDTGNAFVRTANVPTYMCPSDPNAGKLQVPASGPGSGVQYMIGSYRAVEGVTDGLAWFDAECARGYPLGQRGVLHSASDPLYPTAFPSGYTAPPESTSNRPSAFPAVPTQTHGSSSPGRAMPTLFPTREPPRPNP